MSSHKSSLPNGEPSEALAKVIAVQRLEVPAGGDFHNRSEVDAAEIRLHEVDGFELLRILLGDVNIRVRRRDLKDVDIRIVAEGDVP